MEESLMADQITRRFEKLCVRLIEWKFQNYVSSKILAYFEQRTTAIHT